MSIAVAIYCDDCGHLAGSGRTVRGARAEVRAAGGRTALPGGKDRCHLCTAGCSGETP